MMCTGKVTSHNGHVQIQIGSSWGKISLINGQTVRRASQLLYPLSPYRHAMGNPCHSHYKLFWVELQECMCGAMTRLAGSTPANFGAGASHTTVL